MNKLFMIVTVCAALAGSIASAHDIPGLIGEDSVLDDAGRQAMAQIEAYEETIGARIKAAGGDLTGLEGVVDSALAWKADSVTVCFWGGRSTARNLIAALAKTWTEGTRVTLDFGSAPELRSCDAASPSDVRVGFTQTGHWSTVGATANFVPTDQPTLNLQGMEAMTEISQSARGIILHEFGHALGFKHEHQTYVADCESEFNWTYLYTAFGWSKDKVDRNMKKLSKSSTPTLRATELDLVSIMMYSLAKEAFKDATTAKCYIPEQNTEISKLDRLSMQALYPPRAAMALDMGIGEPQPNASIDQALSTAVDGLLEMLK